MRKTKIVCTIGPASSDPKIFTEMCKAGLNVARLNFSHGTHPEHLKKLNMIKKVREELNLPIAIMLDTKGPEYRIKTFEHGKIFLQDGDEFSFTTEDIVGNQSRVSVTYAGLVNDISIGDRILVNNGLVIFEVIGKTDTDVRCRVITGGELSNRKSMSFPNKVLNQVYLSEQDKQDLRFGIQNEGDCVAASFVSTKGDMEELKAFLAANGGGNIDLIAKIENRAGVDNIESICEVADGVMIARAALGDPWLFERVNAAIESTPEPKAPNLQARMNALRRQVEEMVEQKGEFVAMPQARAQTMHYMKGLKGAAALRRYCCTLTHLEDLDELIDAVFEEQRKAGLDPDDVREVPFP